jgi:hypothetical protein
MSCGFNRLNVAIAAAADPQHQSFLVQLAVLGVEIDRNFRCAFGRRLSARRRGIFARRGRFAGGTSSFSSISLGTGTALLLIGRDQQINCEPALRFERNFSLNRHVSRKGRKYLPSQRLRRFLGEYPGLTTIHTPLFLHRKSGGIRDLPDPCQTILCAYAFIFTKQ